MALLDTWESIAQNKPMKYKRQPERLLSDQLRQIIKEWPESRYRIAKETGVSESLLSKLMTGTRGVSLETLDVLGKYFGLELSIRNSKRIDPKE